MINNLKTTALIPCRSHSVGLPGKNYKKFRGSPLFLWSVKAALLCPYVDDIVVCSCCPEVSRYFQIFKNNQNVGNHNKLTFINRYKELDGPEVKNEAVMKFVAEKFSSDVWIILQSTSPLRYGRLLEKCVKKFIDDKADSLLTVSEIYPFFWRENKKGVICPNEYYKNRPMRQDIKPEEIELFDNGNVYITKNEVLKNENNRIGGKVSLYKTDKFQSLQIDTLDDFLLIEKAAEIHGVL